MTTFHRSLRSLLVPLVSALALLGPGAQSVPAASLPAPHGTGGAIACDHPLALAVGLAALRDGGTAADAAVATALALAVVFPEAGNLGGGGFAVIKDGSRVASLDFRETAPAGARRDMYLDEKGEPRPGASLVGPLAAGVPGSPQGLWELHHRFGKLPWRRVVAPAIRLAEEGFPVDRNLHDQLAGEADLLRRFPETARVWLPGGAPPAVGTVLRLPALAATLRAYAEKGPAALSSGRLADAIEAASRRHGGILTAADLAAYQAEWRPPIHLHAFGWDLASMSLPTSGGILLGETLGILERLGWASLPRFGADRDHLLVEAFRRAYADRVVLGDPSTTEAGPSDLLDPAWLDRRAAEIDRDHATPSTAVAPWSGGAAAPPPPGAEAGDTTHLSVVDGEGRLVSLTTTLNGLFGCGLWVPETGLFLNNEMDDFAAAPGHPNLYGLVQGEANAVRPGKRMLSSITPVVAWRGDEEIALGARGGSLIPTNTAQVLLDLIVDRDPLQAALDRPRLHHQWLPDHLLAEPDALSPETRAELERRGHRIEISTRTARVQAVRRLADGTVEAAREPRGAGAAGVLVPDELPASAMISPRGGDPR